MRLKSPATQARPDQPSDPGTPWTPSDDIEARLSPAPEAEAEPDPPHAVSHAAPVSAAEVAGGQPWASTFPHVEIDELLNRVSTAATLTPAETTALLGAIVDEAKRLRATVVRLTAERVSAAEREAEQILTEARAEAAQLRRSANEAMISRLDEAESASDAVLQAAHTDASRRSRQGQQLLAQTRTEVEDLRARVAALFDSTNGILPLLGETATALGRMESEIVASTASDATVLAGMSTADDGDANSTEGTDSTHTDADNATDSEAHIEASPAQAPAQA